MTSLARHLSGFLREHLPKERRASQHTCEAYAQSFQLLLGFAANRLEIKPSKIAPCPGDNASSSSPIKAETISSDTSSPRSITALAAKPTGVAALTAARSMSPVDSWRMP